MNAVMQRLWAPLPRARLAGVRILVGLFVLGYVSYRLPLLRHMARQDPDIFTPVGPLAWLLGAPLRPALVDALIAATLALSVLFAAGILYRVVAPLLAVAVLAVTCYRSSWGMLFHSENLLFLHLSVLALAPAADVWSLDAWRRSRRRTATPATPATTATPADPDGAAHGFTLRLLAALTMATYFLAGVAKLRNAGWGWVTGDLLRGHIAFDNLRKAELGAPFSSLGGVLLRHAWLFTPLAAFAVLIEVGAPLTLLHKNAARVWALAALGFHWGIVVLMRIPFHYPLSGVAFAGLFPLERLPELWRRLRPRWRGPGSPARSAPE